MMPVFKIRRFAYFGLFATTLAILMFENLLTRIFSVTMWYHFAFMAVSIALFGMTVGAVIVYLLPQRFTEERIGNQLVTTALWFSVTIVISFLIHINLPMGNSETTLISLLFTYVLISIPFVFAGINTCLMLTKFPGEIGRLYAADLSGAALGCIAFILVLRITDGPTAIFVVALIASLAALFYAISFGNEKFKRITLMASLALLVFVSVQTVLVNNQRSLVRLKWVKGSLEQELLHEKWNSYSRIRVWGDPDASRSPFSWGISSTYPAERKTNYLSMDIDSVAATVVSAFDGDLEEVDYLKYDVTNVAHYLRPQAEVLVVGTGGGRDILAALAFEQAAVTGIEINENIIAVVTEEYNDFSGNQHQVPGVTFVNDEARSYITRSEAVYDIIQVSLIDTWAATASGAFVLTENSLYTLEAWETFFEHLTPAGVLSFSRWYFQDLPGEMYRLTALASTALAQQGVANPREHIVIVRHIAEIDGEDVPNGIGTLLVSKAPFSAADLRIIEAVADELLFDLILTPDDALDANFAQIASGTETEAFIAAFPLNIAPPTDDNPFFFQMLRLQNILDLQSFYQGSNNFNVTAVYILGSLLLIVSFLALSFIIVPLLLTRKKLAASKPRNALPLSLFFACIGVGFMMIEISQLQRLTVFLGHPTYSLSVVLFSLLLSSGIGSYLTQGIRTNVRRAAGVRLLVLLGVIGLFGLITPTVIRTFAGAITPVRIIMAVLILFPMGLFMGMAFPLGMKIAARQAPSMTPWFWGINGAMSVFASVFTVVISVGAGIATSFWTGLVCYVVAFAAILWMIRFAKAPERALRNQP